ncbi:MAG: MATE family efflux transporter [Euryarchaeota archaeon]|nr:MATE family efflux transporter [Euryarchaeota archaeon]
MGLFEPGDGKLRGQILRFTWPVILTNLLQTLTVTVNLVMVGRLGPEEVAGVGLASQIVFFAYSVMIAVSAGTIALIARYTGAKQFDKSGGVLRQSLILAVLLSIPIMLMGWFMSEQMMWVFGAEPAVQSVGAVYVKYIFMFAPFSFMEFIFSAALRGAGDMKTPLYVAVLNNVVNVVVGQLLIFGHFGFPEMGVMGASLANVAAFTAGTCSFFVLLARKKFPFKMPRGKGLFDREATRRVLRIGWPSALEQFVIQAGFLVFTAIIVYFGTTALAAHNIGQRVQSLAFMPGMGLSVAATALVGYNLGTGEPKKAEECGWESTKLAILMMCAVAAFMFVFAEQMAWIFIDDQPTVQLASIWIRLQAISMPAVGIHFTLSGALRGAGDTRWPLVASAIGIYAVRLPLSVFIGIYLGIGIMGAWLAFIIEYYVRSVVILWRFRRGSWKTIKV